MLIATFIVVLLQALVGHRKGGRKECAASLARWAAGTAAQRLWFSRLCVAILGLGHWPTADEGDVTAEAASYARLWRPKPKVVFSTTLSEAPWNATVVPEITTASVARLTSQTEGDLIVFGGATVVGELFGLDVVDEVDAFVHPVLLGGGVPLFPALGERRPMRLLESSVFEPGVVHLRYERA